jgi:dihydropyrimidinase
MYPRKGVIQVGSDADLVIIDLNKRGQIHADQLHSRADYTPYEGMELTAVPVTTISRGEVIVENGYPGTIVGKPGRGKFLKRIVIPS